MVYFIRQKKSNPRNEAKRFATIKIKEIFTYEQQPETTLKKALSSDISVTSYDESGKFSQIRLFEQRDSVVIFAMSDDCAVGDTNLDTFTHGGIRPLTFATAVVEWFVNNGHLPMLALAMQPAIAKDMEKKFGEIFSK